MLIQVIKELQSKIEALDAIKGKSSEEMIEYNNILNEVHKWETYEIETENKIDWNIKVVPETEEIETEIIEEILNNLDDEINSITITWGDGKIDTLHRKEAE